MGLDAFVWCNCIQTGKLHTPHPYPELLIVHESGSPDVETDDVEKEEAHDEWQNSSPCEHEQCALVAHYLGNITLVAGLRESVKKLSDDVKGEFPVLWSGVIYCGTHCGDFLEVDEVRSLKAEIIDLRSRDFAVLDADKAQFMNAFLEQMDELVEASLSINKPIAF